MAVIENNGNQVEIENNTEIKEACEQLGVPFGCKHGHCGACTIKIVEGKGNLSKMTDEEIDMGMDGEYRLACQCKITEGKVIIDY